MAHRLVKSKKLDKIKNDKFFTVLYTQKGSANAYEFHGVFR